jgi:uncharacterized protein YxeA
MPGPNHPDMKKLILILAVLLMVSCKKYYRHNTIILYDANLESINGNVKQLTEMQCRTGDKGKHLCDTTNFDKNGDAIETRIDYGSSPNVILKYVINYKGDNKTEAIISEKGKMVFNYDNDGYVTKSIFYNQKGSVSSEGLYKYNSNGNVIERTTEDSSSHPLDKWRNMYDKKGHLIEEDYISKKDEPTLKFTYQYKSFDSKHNWTKRIRIVRTAGRIISFEKNDTITRKISYY